MAPVGREFGSPDFDRLMDEDAKKFASDLARRIQQSSASNAALQLEEDEVSDARNVQLALRELGQDVTIDVAASAWKHYSQSLMTNWRSDAETVQWPVGRVAIDAQPGGRLALVNVRLKESLPCVIEHTADVQWCQLRAVGQLAERMIDVVPTHGLPPKRAASNASMDGSDRPVSLLVCTSLSKSSTPQPSG